ncbi:uncharacterized protein RCH25_016766 [Pelodytes ibericus]
MVPSRGGFRDDADRLHGLLWLLWSWEASGASPNVVSARLAGISFWFKLSGLRDVTKDFIVRQSLKGFRMGCPRTRDSRAPVSGALLLGICQTLPSVCVSGFESTLFRLAFTFAFFGPLRVGELVCPSKNVIGGVMFEDVIREPGSVRFKIRQSKTDVMAKGSWVTLREVAGSAVCPVACFDLYSLSRPSSALPLLVHQDGVPLSRFQFIRVFKLTLEALGLNSDGFGGHSFRIGAASEADRIGFTERAIQRIGRWESRRFLSYVRPDGLTAVSSALSSQVQHAGRSGS